jgi:hypothetical protein
MSFSFVKKNNIILNTTKHKFFVTVIFCSRLVVKQNHCDTFVKFRKHQFVMQLFKNPPLCSSIALNMTMC